MADADTDRGRRWWRLGEGVLDVIAGPIAPALPGTEVSR